MSEPLRLMAVHAHPDDESSKGAGTLARYVAEGAEVLVVSCTGGERGDVLNPRLQHDPEVAADIVAYRRREMAHAVAELGVKHEWLGFVDSGLPEGDPLPPLPEGCFALQPLQEASRPLVELVRSFRPHVMTTYDENGGYPHPDHIMCHRISVEAFEAAGDPDRYRGAGEPWQPLKLYYDRVLNPGRMRALDAALREAGQESPFGGWLERMERDGRPVGRITTQIDVSRFMEVRDRALRAHATQIDPDGWFFMIPHDVQRRVWPWEDFELVRTLVPVPEHEDDLFCGLRESVEASDGAR